MLMVGGMLTVLADNPADGSGYGNVKWGMGIRQVTSKVKGLKKQSVAPELIGLVKESSKTKTYYWFDKDHKLFWVLVDYDVGSNLEAVKKNLNSKYGTPKIHKLKQNNEIVYVWVLKKGGIKLTYIDLNGVDMGFKIGYSEKSSFDANYITLKKEEEKQKNAPVAPVKKVQSTPIDIDFKKIASKKDKMVNKEAIDKKIKEWEAFVEKYKSESDHKRIKDAKKKIDMLKDLRLMY